MENRAKRECQALRCAFLLGCLLLAVPAARADDALCLDCHADPELVRETEYRKGSSVFVDPAALSASAHEGVECIDCHADADEDHRERLAPAACADCHGDVREEYDASLHGRALARGSADAPTCADCHGAHDLLAASDPAARTHPQNLPRTCATCHADPEFIGRQPVALVRPLAGYEQSIHFEALMEGRGGPTCSDCHEAHALRRASDPRSAIHHAAIPTTCGRCHDEIRQVYEGSIHGRALARGNTDAPDCADCHGEHEIRRPDDPLSRVYPTAIVQSTCVQCHESVRITSRYEMQKDRSESYRDTYHGLARRDGSMITAHCASCHGVHNILPSTDPASTIHADNLQATCGECHPRANRRFTEIPVHAGAGTRGQGHWLAAFVRQFYIWVIALVLGAMAAHNGAVFAHAVRRKYRQRRAGRTYVRLNRFQVLQHAVLALSFATLVFSGFALKFPDAWWVAPLSWVGMDESLRRLVHRSAGVVLLAQSLVYAGYLVFDRGGRRELLALLPRLSDWRDLRLSLRYYFGRSGEKPAYDRYNYVEKIEFWAVVWGVLIMGASGLVLWFPELFTRFFPALGVQLAEIVHYYEAWLATLAILVWHFFYVIFFPGEYPLNLTCLDGKISEEEMAEHHPLEYERRRGESRGGDAP